MPFITEWTEHSGSRLYTENHINLLRETKEELNKWMHIAYFNVNIVRCSLVDLMQSNENNSNFFIEMYKLILNFIWQCKGPRIVKIVLKKMIVELTLLISSLTVKIQ